LLLTVDCGIASLKDVALARQLGMSIIVTDHHQPGEMLPDANAIVHPALPGSTYPFPHLCGAGVAFKLGWALFQVRAGSEKLPANMRDQLFQSIVFAAIGTVADVVPLTGENRILVHHGLNLLRAYGGVGLTELSRLAKISPEKKLTSEDIGFSLGPRLNAAGRLGPGQLGVELLVTDQTSRAAELAEYIDNLNDSRGSIERSIMIAARKKIEAEFDPVNDPAIVVSGSDWNKGVIGIVAGRLS
jgi:single-stranded-DNA-specific exonuclease